MFLTSSHLELSFRAVSETGTSPTPARTPTLKSWLEMRTLTPANYRKFPHFAVPFVNHTIVYSSPPQYTFTAGPVKKNEFGGNGIEKKTAGPAFPVRPRPALSLPCEPRQAAHRFARRSLPAIRSGGFIIPSRFRPNGNPQRYRINF